MFNKLVCCSVVIIMSAMPIYAISVSDEQIKLDIPGLPFAINVSKNLFDSDSKNGDIIENSFQADGFEVKNKTGTFFNGDTYVINRLIFNETKKENHVEKVFMEGEELHIKYVNLQTKEEVYTTNPSNVIKNTMLVSSEKEGFLVGVPAVYKNNFESKTLTSVPEKENLLGIEKVENGYNLIFSFPHEVGLIGEYWYMKSQEALMDKIRPEQFNELLYYELGTGMRWSYDGFYVFTPYNYTPNGDNVYYNQPSSYTGASIMRNGGSSIALNYAYVTAIEGIKNQNELGYFKTNPSSEWLMTDFNISGGFYDTRFNTDFVRHLVKSYQIFPEQEIMNSITAYTDFYMDFAENNHYPTKNGGILVQDYWHENEHIDTHVSLNHHLAELNFLYEVYDLTKNQIYLDFAERMLQGVVDTEQEWLLSDGNLAYALHYTGDYLTLVDYPYLTYNDLYETQSLLKKYFNRENETINNLTESKKMWMDRNNVTGYSGYNE